MSELKCPFCQQELREVYCNGICLGLICKNRDCLETKDTLGNKAIWQELIRTRKALDVAVDALKEIKDGKIPVSLGICMDINDALDKITALEQKDVK